MSSRRALLLAGAAGLVGTALAACATPTPPATSVAATPAPPPPTIPPPTPVVAPTATAAGLTVVWSNWAVDAGSRNRLAEQQRLFASAHPGIALDVVNTPSAEYMPKLLSAFAADQTPDVVRLNTEQLPVFARRRQVVDLDPLFGAQGDAWIRRSDVQPGLVERYRFAEGLVGLPYGGDMDVLFVNRSLFAESSTAPPPATYADVDWTYDRALDLARAMAKRRPDGGVQTFGLDIGGYRYEGHVENAGGAWFTADGTKFTGHEAPAVAAIDWLAALRLRHQVAPAPGTDDARTFNFASGRLAMSWSGVSQVSNRLADVAERFDWDIAPVPRWGSNPRVVKSGFSALTLSARSRAGEAAWKALHWITGPEGSLPDVETGWSVPVFTSLESRYFARVAAKKNLTVALEGPRFPSKYPIWRNPNYAEAWRRIQVALDLILQGRGTAGDVLAAARPEVDAILAKA